MRPYQGLLVILMMFNSSDIKNENNALYEFKQHGGTVEQWYVVRDLGTALRDVRPTVTSSVTLTGTSGTRPSVSCSCAINVPRDAALWRAWSFSSTCPRASSAVWRSW